MKKNKSIITALVSVCLAFMGGIMIFGASASAENTVSNSLTVSPPRQMVALIPGETYEGDLKVSNASNSDKDSKFSVSVGSYSQIEDKDDKHKKVDDVEARSNYNQIMDWIELDMEEGTVAPGDTVVVPYSIKVPNNAPAGGQYATIIIRDTTNDNGGDGNVAIQNMVQFASIIYATVAGDTKENGSILENNIPAFLLDNHLEASASVKNEGNVHTDAEYTLQVWPLFSDEEICTNEENSEKGFVLPEQEQYHTQSCELPAIGIYKAKQTVKIFGEVSEVENMVIYCPLWLLFLILFVFIAIVIWVVMHFIPKKNKNKRTETEQQS